jgi:hypothetical protein
MENKMKDIREKNKLIEEQEESDGEDGQMVMLMRKQT